jgi:hypothetical protein
MRNYTRILTNDSLAHSGHNHTPGSTGATDFTNGLPVRPVGLTGRKDSLIGLVGYSNSFSLTSNSLSLLPKYDVITNFQPTDSISSQFVSNVIMLTGGKDFREVSKLNAKEISKVFTKAAPLASGTVGSFSVRGKAGTFLILNDDQPGFQSGSDAIIFLAN